MWLLHKKSFRNQEAVDKVKCSRLPEEERIEVLPQSLNNETWNLLGSTKKFALLCFCFAIELDILDDVSAHLQTDYNDCAEGNSVLIVLLSALTPHAQEYCPITHSYGDFSSRKNNGSKATTSNFH